MRNPSIPFNAFIFCALACEARPLIDLYKLKKDTSITVFSIFRNDDIVLTVTGIGKAAMAAGVAYALALFSKYPNPILLNIGIAGHQNYAVGDIFLADKITDLDSSKSYYPPLIFSPPCPTAMLTTFNKPQQAYPELALCDMEASAFYETASRFSSSELIHCLKVISDNETVPALAIRPQQASDLIRTQLPVISEVLSELGKLQNMLKPQESEEFNQLVSQFHFSASEQVQLKKMLCRWQLIKGNEAIDLVDKQVINGKDILKKMRQHLDDTEFYL